MKIRCLHGYFIFEETKSGEISSFVSTTGLELVARDHYYTFAKLAAAPDYSIKGKDLLGIPATKTFAGKPWEVFAANGFVYDFSLDVVRPLELTVLKTTVKQAGKRFVSPGLIVPGSITVDGRVQDFSAWFSMERLTWLYSEVGYV